MAIEFNIFKLPQRWFTIDYTSMFMSLVPDGFAWIFERYLLGTVIQDIISDGGTSWQDTTDSLEDIQDAILSHGASGNVLRRFLSCFASELERIEASLWSAINQTDPGVAVEMLPEWEDQLGLPESCYASLEITQAERQRAAHSKLFDTGTEANAQFYIDYASTLGFVITVEEIPTSTSPRIMGVAIMGVEPMGGYSGNSIIRITVISGTSDTDILVCALERLKPAHVTIDWILP